MNEAIELIEALITIILTIGFYGIGIYTCIRIIRYINMREDEAYQNALYYQAKRDLQDIEDQINRKP